MKALLNLSFLMSSVHFETSLKIQHVDLQALVPQCSRHGSKEILNKERVWFSNRGRLTQRGELLCTVVQMEENGNSKEANKE